MKKTYCDICGSEVKEIDTVVYPWSKEMFYDLNDYPIEDLCADCFKTLYCCAIMMKETGWRPDFHEKLNSDSLWDSDHAGYTLSKLQDKTGLKLF